MSTLADLTQKLAARSELAPAEIAVAAGLLADTAETDEAKAAFLTALSNKGETAAEVAAFARAFRTLAINPGVEAWAPRAIDLVGTGGDHAGGFNISSLTTLVLASAGVPVLKHGNRAVTSQCGSADLLGALGVNLNAGPELIRAALAELGYVFFFAPAWHPAFKQIMPVRKLLAARGQRTIFNLLGPLLNPGRPAHVLIGVGIESMLPHYTQAVDLLEPAAGLVVHGVIEMGAGIDELTTATINAVRGVGRLRGLNQRWWPGQLGFEHAAFGEIKGGDLATNLAIVDALLAGRGPAGLVDTIALNAAVALWIVGKTASVHEGLAPARELLLGGAVKNKIAATREFYRS